ncbi:MAG: hypothetical protein FJX74_17190 [Armatimonadetes bacterium]|nr:hypothetical protein [Armatimonadota bacterium]
MLRLPGGERVYDHQDPLLQVAPTNWSPDGSQLLVDQFDWGASAPTAANGLYAWDARTGAMRPAASGIARAIHGNWLPQGDGLVFQGLCDEGRPAVYALPLATMSARVVALDAMVVDGECVRPADNGQYKIFFRRSGRDDPEVAGVWVTVARGAQERRLLPIDGSRQVRWSVSPDGSMLAAACSKVGKGAQVLLHDCSSGAEVTRTAADDRLWRPVWSPDGRSVLCVGRSSLWVLDVNSRGLAERSTDLPPSDSEAVCAWSRAAARVLVARGAAVWLLDPSSGHASKLCDLAQ